MTLQSPGTIAPPPAPSEPASTRAGDAYGSPPEAYLGYGSDWRIVEMDEGARTWAARAGLDPDALLGRVLWDAVPATLGSGFEAPMRRAMRDRAPVRFVVRGAVSGLWFETFAYPVGDGLGAFSREVTARVQAERTHRVLAEAGRVLGEASLDVEATLSALAAVAIPDLADWCFVDEAEEDGGFTRRGLAHADPAHAALAARLHRRFGPRREIPGITRTIETGRSLLLPELTEAIVVAGARDEDHLAALREMKLHTAIVVPLRLRGRVVGTLTLGRSTTPGAYRPEDLAVAEELARRAATALETARLYQLAEAAAERVTRLQEVTGALGSATRVREVARVIVEQGVRALDACSGAVVLVRPGTATLDVVGTLGYPAGVAERLARVPLDAPLPATEAARGGEPVYVRSAAERAHRYPALAEVWRGQAGEALAVLPLRARGAPLGSIVFNFAEERGFDAGDRGFLEALAHQCAQALDRARLYESELEARRRADAVLESIDDGFASVDSDWRIRFVNAPAAQMAGRTRGELRGKLLWDVVGREAATPLVKAMKRVMEGRHSEELDAFSEVLGGRWVNARVYPADDGGISIIFRDTSERSRAEQALRESESRLRSALEVASLALWSVDLRTGQVVDSPRLREMMGVPAGHEGPVDWAALVHPDDARRVREELEAAVRRAAETGAGVAYRTEARAVHADGTVRWIAPSGHVLCDAEGRPVQILGVARDITERVLAETERAELFSRERELRLAAERSAARTARLQRVTALLAGALPTDEVASLFAGQAREAFAADVAWVGVRSVDGTEIARLAEDGYLRKGHASRSRLRADADTPAAAVLRGRRAICFTDRAACLRAHPGLEGEAFAELEGLALLPMEIGGEGLGVALLGFRRAHRFDAEDTAFALGLAGQCGQALERARLYEAERLARDEAEEANRAKSAFLATMSHELRTPLNAIGGYAELLEMGVYGELPANQRDVVLRVQRSQRHLLSLINDVLNFARIEAGHVELSIGVLECASLLGGLESLVGPQLAAKGITYRLTPPAGAPRVRADGEKVRQVLLNLLSNAIKFTPAGGSIDVGAEAEEGTVRIHVRDTGTGIPPEHLERVFDPFVQVGRTLSSPREGVGLGLAISRDLARAMGGDLVAESVAGSGSVFTLLLPRD